MIDDGRDFWCFILTAGMGGLFALVAARDIGPGPAALACGAALLVPPWFIWRIDDRRRAEGR